MGLIRKIIKNIMPYGLLKMYLKTKPKNDYNFIYNNDPNVFDTIYKTRMWGSIESYSGGGSHISTTKIIRALLLVLWDEYKIKTFLDVPCGDYNWMKEVPKKNIHYIGGDIVTELIEKNNIKYKSNSISFIIIDITQDDLPNVDMIFCKDCLQHLSDKNVFKALKNFKLSKSKYLLVTSYPLTLYNKDICDGDYRPLNLRLNPYNFPEPIEEIHETSKGSGMEKDKYMYLYKLEDIEL